MTSEVITHFDMKTFAFGKCRVNRMLFGSFDEKGWFAPSLHGKKGFVKLTKSFFLNRDNENILLQQQKV